MRDTRRDIVVALGILIAIPAVALCQETAAQVHDPNYLGTFSIIGRDPDTGQLGMGVQSKAFGAGNRAMHAKGGLVIIAHQAAANPMYGAIGIELLQAGYSPEEALAMMVASDEGRDRRQTAILDQQGRTAAWTGTGASDWKGHKCGVDYCAQGNILTGPEVVDAMATSFESSTGPLAERLMDALDAAQAAGGDARGRQSGAILVVAPRVNGGYSDRVVDIRVDDHDEPLVELRRVLNMYRSGQMLREAGRMRRDGDLRGAVALVRGGHPQVSGERQRLGLDGRHAVRERTRGCGVRGPGARGGTEPRSPPDPPPRRRLRERARRSPFPEDHRQLAGRSPRGR